MADTIRIESGEKRILVNDDENRVITFNPHDILFTERFYNLLSNFDAKAKEFSQKADEIGLDENDLDDNGIPKKTGEVIALTREVCEYMRAQIDHVFGEGTSQAAFGDMNTLNMFEQFFEGITPFIQKERTAKVQKYQKGKR